LGKIRESLPGFFGFIIYIAIGLLTLYGIFHSFTKHSTGRGFFALFIPPYAIYMGLEGLIWHDDFAGVNWKVRLKNDIRATYYLIGSYGNVDETKINEYNRSIEDFAKSIKKYPNEKREHLETFGSLYINYTKSLLEDLSSNIEKALTKGLKVDFNESKRTLDLEKELISVGGSEELIREIKIGLAYLKQKFDDIDPVKFENEETEKFLRMLRQRGYASIENMIEAYTIIFDHKPTIHI
jgi:hypothetical protein